MSTSKSDDAVNFEISNAKAQIQDGSAPLKIVTVSGIVSTATSALNITGASNPGSADTLMQGQLVVGSRVTTLTTTGYIQVNIVDSAGNITEGKHYIPFGTLT